MAENRHANYVPRAKPKPVRPPKPKKVNKERLKILAERRKQNLARQAAARKAAAERQKKARAQAAPKAELSPELEARLEALKDNYDNLQDDAALADIYSEVADIESTLTELDTELDKLRSDGYVFGAYLENKIDILTNKWEALEDDLDDKIEEAVEQLRDETDGLERQVRLALGGSESAINKAERSLETVKSKINTAEQTIKSQYQDVSGNVYQTYEQLESISWAFNHANQADFDFLEGEYLILACKAEMLEHAKDKDGEEGILYLTDERLLFEQKEKKATKKFLFVTTESETVQELKFDALLGWLEDVKAQDKRKMLSNKELVNITLSHEAPLGNITFHVKDGAKNEFWVPLINRAINGEIERERIASAVEEKETASQQVSEAPTACSMCGASLPATIARGQTEITCEYCGSITRL